MYFLGATHYFGLPGIHRNAISRNLARYNNLVQSGRLKNSNNKRVSTQIQLNCLPVPQTEPPLKSISYVIRLPVSSWTTATSIAEVLEISGDLQVRPKIHLNPTAMTNSMNQGDCSSERVTRCWITNYKQSDI